MKYFNKSVFISHSNIYYSISAVTGMNEFFTLQTPTVEGNGLINFQAYSLINVFVKVMFFII